MTNGHTNKGEYMPRTFNNTKRIYVVRTFDPGLAKLNGRRVVTYEPKNPVGFKEYIKDAKTGKKLGQVSVRELVNILQDESNKVTAKLY